MKLDRDMLLERSRGCLLGGAIGDALGAPIEFMTLSEITSRFGKDGLTNLTSSYGRLGAVTDDTQMMLFTAEGLLRGQVRGLSKGITTYEGCIHHAYMRWLITQGYSNDFEGVETNGWLFANRDLFYRRAPGNTCLSALKLFRGFGQPAENDSKGCGGIMRAAPIGVFCAATASETGVDEGAKRAFELGVNSAALTHGHPTGQLPAGAFAEIIYRLALGQSLEIAIQSASDSVSREEQNLETLQAIRLAQEEAYSGRSPDESILALGEGWIAEEALAIGLYAAITAESFKGGVLRGVNHSGDSDSTGLITGHILGCIDTARTIPAEWASQIELRPAIEQVAEDLINYRSWDSTLKDNRLGRDLWEHYPGH